MYACLLSTTPLVRLHDWILRSLHRLQGCIFRSLHTFPYFSSGSHTSLPRLSHSSLMFVFCFLPLGYSSIHYHWTLSNQRLIYQSNLYSMITEDIINNFRNVWLEIIPVFVIEWKTLSEQFQIRIQDRSFSWLGTGTSVKSNVVKVVLLANPPLLM